MENNPQINTQTVVKRNFFSYINPRENTKGFFTSIAIFFAILGLGAYTTSVNNNPQNSGSGQTPSFTPISSNTVVYGYWTKENSVISALDLSTNKNSILAQLPLNIKHVKILDQERIIYIKDTDDRDYGKEISVKTLGSNTETVILRVSEGFGIDDYVVSPNSRYLAVWEVSPPDESDQLFGGKSRVYTVDISNPAQKNLIYDETSGLGIALAYPIAITDTGELFIDRFLPNSGAGWGYGMSVSDFSGANKQNIESLVNGTISTQPIVSKDGKKLLFTGYDGRKGLGTTEINSFRRAMITPNTIEIFDLMTRQKKTLLSVADDEIYSDPNWDSLTGNIYYKLIAKDKSQSGTYVYDLATNTSRKINIDNAPPADSVQDSPVVKNIIAAISGTSFLVFDEDVSDSALGNLGSKYNQSINSIYSYDETSQTQKKANLASGLAQFIDLKPKKYFSELNSTDDLSGVSDGNKNKLQLQTFELKPSLAPKRQEQQSEPKEKSLSCPQLSVVKCNEIMGTNYPITQISRSGLWSGGVATTKEEIAFKECVMKVRKELGGGCKSSPLYLYGEKGQSALVYSATPIYPLNTNYSPVRGYSIRLGENGFFTADGKQVSSLKFDYEPAIKIEKPKKGYLVTKNKIQQIAEKLSDQLGLNEKEREDTLNFIKGKAVSPYIFISLYDDETSKKILPLVISPTPDVYRNTVFYIENLDENSSTSYAPPVIEKIQRKGFTAIEISFIVK